MRIYADSMEGSKIIRHKGDFSDVISLAGDSDPAIVVTLLHPPLRKGGIASPLN
jgi:hypothetical protein